MRVRVRVRERVSERERERGRERENAHEHKPATPKKDRKIHADDTSIDRIHTYDTCMIYFAGVCRAYNTDKE